MDTNLVFSFLYSHRSLNWMWSEVWATSEPRPPTDKNEDHGTRGRSKGPQVTKDSLSHRPSPLPWPPYKTWDNSEVLLACSSQTEMRGARGGKAFSSYFLPSSTDFLQRHVQEGVPSTRQGCYPHLDKVADDIQHNIRTRRLQALDSFVGWKSVQLAPWLSKKGHSLSTPVSCIFKTS